MKTKKLIDVIVEYYLWGLLGAVLFLVNYFANQDKFDLPYVWFIAILTALVWVICMGKAIYLTAVKIRPIDSKPYRRAMYQYFSWKEWSYVTSITKVEVHQTLKGVVVLIETHRPGLLIGKGGRFIDGLLTHLKEELEDPNIKIDLKECKLWYKLYS